MEKDYSKRYDKAKYFTQTPKNKSANRFWGNAARLEHSNIKGRNSRKSGGSEKTPSGLRKH